VTSCLGKLFTALFNTRLRNFVRSQNLLHPSKIGFLEGFQTTDHIISLRTLIDKYVNPTLTKENCFAVSYIFKRLPILYGMISYKMGGRFYQLISERYCRFKCAIKCGNRRTKFFDNRGVRQGCILFPLLFNLYLNDIPFLSDNSCDTDSIILPNGLPLNCLFYADDLVLISRSAFGLQKQIDILQNYV